MENKINIGMFSDSFYPIIGGRENVIHNLMTALNNKTNCFLLTTTFKGHKSFISDNDLPYKVYRCKSLRLTKNEYLSIIDKKTKYILLNKIKNKEVNIIHTQTKYALTKYALKLGKKYNIPVITSAHTNYIEQYKKQLKLPFIYKPFLNHVKRIINKTSGVITVSNYMKNLLLNMGITVPISIIPNGNDLTEYIFSPNDLEQTYLKYNLTKEDNILIFVGRITETKNLSFLFNTLKQVKNKNISFKFIIVGSGDINKYKNLASHLSLTNNCIFTGAITDREELAKLYTISNLNVYPSTGESFGLTIREAGSMGTPSVTIENCATSENIIHGKNGYISKLDETEFANIIISALHDREKLSIISHEAQKTFNSSWTDIADQHIIEYNKYINQKSQH